MIRLAVRVARADAEVVLAELLELAPGGLEERAPDADSIEYVLYGAPGELPALPALRAAAGDALVDVSSSELPDDWAERWKRFHVPVLIGGRLWVRPPWEQEAVRPGVHEIVIDPGQAFGTGTHPTTRLCLELLLDLEPSGSLADLGCGSGVLAIAAAKLGWEPVRAYDSDRAAVAATLANARDNGVVLDAVERFDLRHGAPPAAWTVAANLMRPLLLALTASSEERPQVAVLSGLLEHEADEVAAAWAPMREERRVSDRGWSALLLRA